MKTIVNTIVVVGLLGLLFGCGRQAAVEPANAALTGGRLDITDFAIAGQLGKTVIDFDTREVYVYVPFNFNTANIRVTKALASPQANIMTMGNPLVEGMNYDFSTPLNVQVIKGNSQKDWKITVRQFAISDFQAATFGFFEYRTIDHINRRIDFDYVIFFEGLASPKSVQVRFDLLDQSGGTTIPINRQFVDLSKPFKFTITASNGYSEEWTLYGEQVVILCDENTPPFAPGISIPDYVGWDFDNMQYVKNYPANKKEADLSAILTEDAAMMLKDLKGVSGGLDPVTLKASNLTLYAFHGDNAMSQNFYRTCTKAEAKAFFDTNSGMANPFISFPIKKGEVYVVKTSDGDYVLIRIADNPNNNGFGMLNDFLFAYRKFD